MHTYLEGKRGGARKRAPTPLVLSMYELIRCSACIDTRTSNHVGSSCSLFQTYRGNFWRLTFLSIARLAMEPAVATTGAARKARQRKARSNGRHVQWLASCFQATAMHHTGAQPRGDYDIGQVLAQMSRRVQLENLGEYSKLCGVFLKSIFEK